MLPVCTATRLPLTLSVTSVSISDSRAGIVSNGKNVAQTGASWRSAAFECGTTLTATFKTADLIKQGLRLEFLYFRAPELARTACRLSLRCGRRPPWSAATWRRFSVSVAPHPIQGSRGDPPESGSWKLDTKAAAGCRTPKAGSSLPSADLTKEGALQGNRTTRPSKNPACQEDRRRALTGDSSARPTNMPSHSDAAATALEQQTFWKANTAQRESPTSVAVSGRPEVSPWLTKW